MSTVNEKNQQSKHTPEPWEVRTHHIPAQGWTIGTVPRSMGSQVGIASIVTGENMTEDNAARIVACVNALAGMNPEAIPDAIAALEAVGRSRDLPRTTLDGIAAALATLRGDAK